MENEVLVALLLITGLAAVVPILSKKLDRFGIPIVVYEIIAGIIIGTSWLNLIEPSTILTFLAEFGFAFLMFLSGLELDSFTLRNSDLLRHHHFSFRRGSAVRSNGSHEQSAASWPDSQHDITRGCGSGAQRA